MADVTVVNSIHSHDPRVPLGPLYLCSFLEAQGYDVDFRDYQTCDADDPFDMAAFLAFADTDAHSYTHSHSYSHTHTDPNRYRYSNCNQHANHHTYTFYCPGSPNVGTRTAVTSIPRRTNNRHNERGRHADSVVWC